MTMYPLIPAWLVILLILTSIGVFTYSIRDRNPLLSPFRLKLLFCTRLFSLAVLAILLLCPGTLVEDLNTERSHMALLIDRSESMGAQDTTPAANRLAAAEAFVRSLDLDKLDPYPIHTYTFADDCQPVSLEKDTVPKTASGGTSFATALATLDKDIGLSRLAGIVLVTDGIDHSTFTGSATSTPIFTVQTGTDLTRVRDIAIGDLTLPEKVSVGDEVAVDFTVLSAELTAGDSVPVTARIDGEEVFQKRLTPVTGSAPFSFSHTFLTEGIHILTLTLPSLAGEASVLNNTRTVAIEVTEAKDEILAYFPLLSNSFRPLIREFETDEKTVFTACLKISDDRFNLRGRNLNAAFQQGIPEKANVLQPLNCLILSAFNSSLLSPAEINTIEQYVSNGGSLILLGGKHSFAGIQDHSALAKLLPVITGETSFSDTVFSVSIDADTAETPFGRQLNTIFESTPVTVQLNGLNRVRDLRPGTHVLLWAETEQRAPLLVWRPYGRGKVLAVLTNSLHLWGENKEQQAKNFSLVWRQLVAFSRRADEEAEILKLAPVKNAFLTDERIEFTALVTTPTHAKSSLAVDLFPIGSDDPIASTAPVKTGDMYQGFFPPAPPGPYTIRAQLTQAGKLIRQRYKFIQVGADNAEKTDLAARPERFERFAPPNRRFTLKQGDELIEALNLSALSNRIEKEHFPIFETPVFLLALIAVLVFEWYLRRRFNLF